jgi:hypothetical protein
MRVQFAVDFPCRDFDEGAHCVGAATPGEPGSVDGATGSLFVAAQESLGESTSDRTGRSPNLCGSAQRRVGEHQRREREVVGGSATTAVDHSISVHRSQSTSRLNGCRSPWQMTCVSCGVAARCSAVRSRSCRPMVAACAARRPRKSWTCGWRAWPGELAVKSVDRALVKRSGGLGEQVGQSSQQGRNVPDRGRGAESGEQRLAGGKVHQTPGAIEVKARPGGAANGRHREPVSREVALHGGFERSGGGVGHDPGDEATVEVAWCSSEFDGVHLGPETSSQRDGWTGPRHRGSVRVAAQRGKQAVGRRVPVCDHEAPDLRRPAGRRRGE